MQNDTPAPKYEYVEPNPNEPLNTLPLVEAAAAAIWDKKGFEVVALRVREIVQYTDYLVIASATSDRHAMAIADGVEDRIFKEFGQKPIGSEGRRQGRWVLVDFGDIVVHIFHRPVRDYYEIERLYADAPRVELVEPQWLKDTSPDMLIEQAVDYGDELWRTTNGADWDEEAEDSGSSAEDAEGAGDDGDDGDFEANEGEDDDADPDAEDADEPAPGSKSR